MESYVSINSINEKLKKNTGMRRIGIYVSLLKNDRLTDARDRSKRKGKICMILRSEGL